MKFAVNFQATERTTASFGHLARKCEALGFEAVFINEHVAIPAVVNTPYLAGGGPVPEYYAHFPDPFICLAAAAAETRTIKLGTAVSLVPEHDPIVLAKTLATLDVVSGGRIIYGAGAGWLREECEAMGVDFARRWDHAVECIQAMKKLWTEDAAAFDGEFVRFPPLRCYPKPVQRPHVPVHIGAGGLKATSDRAQRLTVAVGDGWMPTALSPGRMKEELAILKRLCDAAGRDFEKIEITSGVFPWPETRAQARALSEAHEAAGTHRLFAIIAGSDDDPESSVERLAELFLS